MSRADYLAKYMGGQDKKKKKNSPKTKIVVGVSPLAPLPKLDHDDDVPEVSEFAPVTVTGPVPKTNKGFKRIDTGEVVKPATQNATVYRDESGRIVDIEARTKEIQKREEEKKQQDEERLKDTVTGDLAKIEEKAHEQQVAGATRFDVSSKDAEYVAHMKTKKVFDDPAASFASRTTAEVSATGRPAFNKGVSPTNRFRIKAGFFWDGIDRSNGFEDKIVAQRESNRARKLQTAVSTDYTDYDY